MFADVVSVDEKVGDRLCSIELQEEAFVAPFVRDVELLQVVARRLVETVTGQRVVVPRVGEGYDTRMFAIVFGTEEELPPVVEWIYFASQGVSMI